ncbi:MAG: hypothetical protein DHS20C14_16500 [Phycisphaeraceae bacterium]|nr:MAG: hypothetical protein DHS20C14_16500 [Phycisphaeraceae bacterium]
MKLDSLEKLYIEQLKDLYSAENQLLKALPKMRDAATAEPLREAFAGHLEETKEHVARIEKIMADTEYGPNGAHCNAMEGLIKEGSDMLDIEDTRVRDAALVCAAQKVEHYEIATYGCVRAYAKMLGYDDAVKILEQTRAEERAADETLNELAEQWINAFAVKAGAS